MPSLRSIVGSHSVLRYAALAAFRVASFLARFWRPRAFFPLGIVEDGLKVVRDCGTSSLVACERASFAKSNRSLRR